jgi:hypothetical protein
MKNYDRFYHKAQKLDWRKLRARPKVDYRVEAPLCRILELSQSNIDYLLVLRQNKIKIGLIRNKS